MSTQVDTRVVQMKFDNKRFEQNIKQTTNSIEKLKRTSNFSKTQKAFQSLDNEAEKAAKSTNLLANSMDKVSMKTVAMGAVVVTAMQRITNKVIDTGKAIISALTIDPIKTGLDEYELKIRSIQTILSNTKKWYQSTDYMEEAGGNANTAQALADAKQLQDVNDILDELNTYADKTIYNFAQMTDNIGKFVAQGLSVKQASKAVQGMANLAAASGASASDMARATYQMSQALGGTIRKIDWNSLRNANMATVTLKDTLIEIAKMDGIDVQKMMDETGKSFEDTLESGWLTGDIFTEAMQVYSGVYSEAELMAKGYSEETVKNFLKIAKDAEEAATKVRTLTQLKDTLKEGAQSGWTETWETVIGDFNEATDLWSAIYNKADALIQKIAKDRNDRLKEWRGMIQVAKFDENGQVMKDEEGNVKMVWRSYKDLTDAQKKWYGEARLAEEEALGKFQDGRTMLINGLKNIATAISKIVTTINKAWRAVFPRKTGEQLRDATKAFEEFTQKLIPSEDALNKLQKILEKVFSVIRNVFVIAKKITVAVVKPLLPLLQLFAKIVIDVLSAIAGIGKPTNEATGEMSAFDKVLQKVSSAISFVVSKIIALYNWLANKGFLETLKKIGTGFVTVFTAIKNVVVGVWNAIKPVIIRIKDNFMKMIKETTGEDVKNAFLSGGIVAIVAAFAKMLLNVAGSFKSVKGIINSFKNVIDEVGNTLKAFQKAVKTSALLNAAKAIAMLAASVVILALIPVQPLVKACGVILVLAAVIVAAGVALSKFSGDIGVKGTIKLSAFMVAFGLAAMAMAAACAKLAKIPSDSYDRVIDGVQSVFLLLLGLVYIILKQTSSKEYDPNNVKEVTKLMKTIAGLVITFAAVLLVLGKAKWKTLGRGAVGLLSIIGIVTLAVGGLVGLAKMKGMRSASVKTAAETLSKLTGMIVALSIVLMALGRQSWKQYARGIVGITSIMGILMLMLLGIHALAKIKSVSPSKIQKITLSLAAITAMVVALSGIVIILGLIPWKVLSRGLAGLVGLFAILIGAFAGLAAVSKIKINPKRIGTVVLCLFAITFMVSALAPLAAILGALPTKVLAKGLIAISIIFGLLIASLMVIGKASKMGKKQAKDMKQMTRALAVLAGAVYTLAKVVAYLGQLDPKQMIQGLIGMGVILGGLIAVLLIVSKVGGDPKKILAITGAILGVAVAMLVMAAAAQAFSQVSFTDILKSLAAVGLVMLALVGLAAIASIPVLGKTFLIALGLIAAAVLVVAAAMYIMAASVGVLASGLMQMYEAINMFATIDSSSIDLFKEKVKSLMELIPEAAKTIGAAIIGLLIGVIQSLPQLGETLLQVLPTLIEQAFQALLMFLDGLIKHVPEILEKIFELIEKLVVGIILGLPKLIIRIGKTLVEEFKKMAHDVWEGFKLGIKEKAEKIKEDIKKPFEKVVGWVRGVFDSHSPSRIFKSIAGDVVDGFAIGLDDGSTGLYKATSSTFGEVTDAAEDSIPGISNAISAVYSAIEGDVDSQPTIRPVMDLTEIQNGISSVNRMTSGGVNYAVSGTYQAAQQITGETIASRNAQALADNNAAVQRLTNTVRSQDGGVVNYNTFNITGTNAEEIANAVSEILQEQVERKVSAWG